MLIRVSSLEVMTMNMAYQTIVPPPPQPQLPMKMVGGFIGIGPGTILMAWT